MHGADLFLIRHGETRWNLERRFQGHRDSPLTGRGIQQGERAGRRLLAELDDPAAYALTSSPLGRARHTAEIVARVIGRAAGEITLDDRLKEMTWGAWDGLTAAEIEARDPELWQARIDDRWTVAPPGGGETQQAILDRAMAWLADLAPAARLVAVAHGALGRAIRCAYLNLPAAAMLELDEPQDAFFRLCCGRIERIEVL